MGMCWSNRIKVVSSSSQTGANSKNENRREYDSGYSSNKFSSASVLLTPWSGREILLSSNLKSFSFVELRSATRNFRPDSVQGQDGFGAVFKGWIDEQSLEPTKPGMGMVIAVKRLKQDGVQGHKGWLAEINYLGRLNHPNLVKLIGYCEEDEQRLLVYEFVARGSMENHLFSRGSRAQPLPWSVRMRVALGAAKGLAFLHNAETKVIYREFKTSNILLDSEYNAKLSDFGLAMDWPTGDQSHVSTRVVGTHGYAAPEYISTGRLTTKSDVYSFGVVFLEMLSGRRTIDKNRPFGEHNLVEWARPYLCSRQKIFQLLDRRLEGHYSLGRALRATTLAMQCLYEEAKLRPNMDEVVETLEQLCKDGA